MTLPRSLQPQIESAIGGRVNQARPVSGGDISDGWRLETAEGRFFLKHREDAPAGFFAAEARGLAELTVTDDVRIPRVLSRSGTWILMEWLETGPASSTTAEALGRGLAEIHRTSAPSFGLDENNFIGTLPQENGSMDRWVDFYRERRLLPQVGLARKRGRLPAARERGLWRLIERLEEWIGDPGISPSLLHGDLWGGNWMAGADGLPCLIDPAVHYGHREVDLAFSRLFGGFPAAFYDAYDETWPPAPGAGERAPLYQLYYLLVHLNLFGDSYGAGVDRVWQRYEGK